MILLILFLKLLNNSMQIYFRRLFRQNVLIRSSASLEIDRCQRLTHSRRLAYYTTSLLFVDRFERSLRLCNLEFDKDSISNIFMAHFRVKRQSKMTQVKKGK